MAHWARRMAVTLTTGDVGDSDVGRWLTRSDSARDVIPSALPFPSAPTRRRTSGPADPDLQRGMFTLCDRKDGSGTRM